MSRFIILIIVAFSFSCSACATLPRRATVAGETSVTAPGGKQGLRMNINTASLQELEKLPGIGEVMAERIVAHRAQYGPFRRAEHLMMVRGISDRKFRAIQSMISAE
jgi:competence protein ComEA